MTHYVEGGCVSIEYLVMGMIENNVYIIGDGASTFVVDPTESPKTILRALGDRTLDAIVLTHFHFDHVGGANELHELTGAPVIASTIDAPIIAGEKRLGPGHHGFAPCPVEQRVSEGDIVEIGAMRWQVLETPGHTPGSICLYIEPTPEEVDADKAPVLISGDTLFHGAHGRTDFEGGSDSAMRKSLERLAKLPKNTIVLPGHNATTTIGTERWLPR